jgi:hypothetical protein
MSWNIAMSGTHVKSVACCPQEWKSQTGKVAGDDEEFEEGAQPGGEVSGGH